MDGCNRLQNKGGWLEKAGGTVSEVPPVTK